MKGRPGFEPIYCLLWGHAEIMRDSDASDNVFVVQLLVSDTLQ